jgi:hypothetical protein
MVGIIGARSAEEGERDLSLLDWSLLRDISPDGKLILFDESGEGGGAVHAVYVRRTDGSPAVRLGEGVGGSFSPDGRWAVSRKAGSRQLVMLPVRAGEARPLDVHGLTYHSARFVPDGKGILTAASEADDAVRLCDFAWHLFPLAGGPPQPVSGLGPDDRPVAFSADASASTVSAAESCRGISSGWTWRTATARCGVSFGPATPRVSSRSSPWSQPLTAAATPTRNRESCPISSSLRGCASRSLVRTIHDAERTNNARNSLE